MKKVTGKCSENLPQKGSLNSLNFLDRVDSMSDSSSKRISHVVLQFKLTVVNTVSGLKWMQIYLVQ